MAVDTLEPFRTALEHFGVAVTLAGGGSTTGLLDSAVEFQAATGIPISGGTHVLQIEAGSLGVIALDAAIVVDDVPYIYRGPAPSENGIEALQLVVQREIEEAE